ncbi:MAG TPA: hypothetical protein VLC09_07485 [Polyangiaceae bacterium]|nr:hypothetical protein [Polyangiaceae bacterium]
MTKSPDPSSASEASGPSQDVVLVHGKTEDNRGLRVLRARGSSEGTRLELGEVRPLEEGKPLTGDVVKLTPRPEQPMFYDVETQFERPRTARRQDTAGRQETAARQDAARRTGPAQVATDSYRKNWDAIWPSGNGSRGSSGLN